MRSVQIEIPVLCGIFCLKNKFLDLIIIKTKNLDFCLKSRFLLPQAASNGINLDLIKIVQIGV